MKNGMWRQSLTAHIEKRGKWYIGFIEEIPGVNSQARTLREVQENLQEALELVLQCNRQISKTRRPGHSVYRKPIAYLVAE